MHPESWKEGILGDYVQIIMGQSPESDYYTSNRSDTPFLQGNRTFGLKYPHFDTYTSKITKKAPSGSVIISVRAPVGDINMAPVELCLGRGVAALVSSDQDNEYLYYLMKYMAPVLNQNETGSTFGAINKTDLHQLPILLPDYTSRLKISVILSTIDNKIRIHQAINDNLLTIASTAFNDLLSDSCFDKINFGAYIEIGSGGTPKTSISDYWNGDIPFFTPKDAQNIYTYVTEKKITHLGLKKCNSNLYPKNTTIITARGTVGKISLTSCDMAMNQSCYAITSKHPGHEHFIHQLSIYAVQSIKQKSNGAVFDAINSKDISEEQVPWISEQLIDHYERIVASIYEQMWNNGKIIQSLVTLRDYLLPKMISGKIDISNLPLPAKYSFTGKCPCNHDSEGESQKQSEGKDR